MLFNSYVFILLYLPIVFICYFLLQKLKFRTAAKGFLVLASLYFYSYWNVKYLPIMIVSILINFLLATLINKGIQGKKVILVLGIIFNISLLGYFKYSDFFLTNVNTLFQSNFPLLQLALPLAISFFTFQQIAYLVDSYRGETKGYSFLNYSFFVSFFPQLIAGPIVHHSEIIKQLEEPTHYKMNFDNISRGLYIFVIGLFKKVIIADTFAIWANDGYSNLANLTFVDSWIVTMSYTFQLYFDFSGYCDMAIGIALIFNLKLPINFNSPYKSLNIQDFWRRWHITLGRFFTKYIYFPLGGSRVGPIRRNFNLFIIFFISGLWHGAGWTFIIWGILHGVASITYRIWNQLGFKLPKLLAWFVTFLFVHIAWVYFRSPDVGTANAMIVKMFSFGELPPKIASVVIGMGLPVQSAPNFFDLKLIILILIFLFIVVWMKNSVEKLNNFSFTIKNAAIISILAVISILYLNRVSEFLYFNF
ncbi:MBOAT family O-acyltransferase [Bacillus sp. SCS-151]|uniref:MBOAT family O-acyltransferase n=1 Tax=Nanhaiella sioensis TaxID=3115293 RepID=UPI00397AB129